MRKLILIGLVGLAAQLVDGGLGMGYGVTSSSLLLLVGLTPALASASVHLAEVGTNVASGLSHWRLGNVDWSLVLRLGVPGAVGAAGPVELVAHEAPPLVVGGLVVRVDGTGVGHRRAEHHLIELVGDVVVVLDRLGVPRASVPQSVGDPTPRRRCLRVLRLVGL